MATSPSSSDTGSLTEMNLLAHERLDELTLSFLEAVTALSLDEAAALFARFREALSAHLGFEEEAVLPEVTRVHAIHGDPKDLLPKHLDGDHRILERTVQKAEAALLRLRAPNESLRRAMVRELDAFLLLRRVLEHHDARETRLAYPLLDAHLSDEERAPLLQGLSRTIPALLP